MSKDFIEALQEKINDLQMRRDELQEEISNIETRLEVLRDLLTEEDGGAKPVAKRGRPKGSTKSKVVEEPKVQSHHAASAELLREAAAMGGTDPALAEKLRNRYRPMPRPDSRNSSGVVVGSKKGNPRQETQSDSTISIDDDTLDPEK